MLSFIYYSDGHSLTQISSSLPKIKIGFGRLRFIVLSARKIRSTQLTVKVKSSSIWGAKCPATPSQTFMATYAILTKKETLSSNCIHRTDADLTASWRTGRIRRFHSSDKADLQIGPGPAPVFKVALVSFHCTLHVPCKAVTLWFFMQDFFLSMLKTRCSTLTTSFSLRALYPPL